MLIVDDILLFPFRSLAWVFKKIHEAAEEELDQQEERITAQLSELYMMVETGKITEEEFEAKEKELLDRLDEIEAYKKGEPEEELEDEEEPEE